MTSFSEMLLPHECSNYRETLPPLSAAADSNFPKLPRPTCITSDFRISAVNTIHLYRTSSPCLILTESCIGIWLPQYQTPQVNSTHLFRQTRNTGRKSTPFPAGPDLAWTALQKIPTKPLWTAVHGAQQRRTSLTDHRLIQQELLRMQVWTSSQREMSHLIVRIISDVYTR